ncbi:MAG: DUF4388 domain-containing protein [Actinomycetota bacterium]
MRPGGQLRRGTLAEVLFEAEQIALSGAITVITDDRQGKVYLHEGRITHARQSVQREFDQWLALLGLVPSDDASIATTLAGRLDTDLAVNAPMIKRLGREYVDRVCADLLRIEEGEYHVQEGELVPHGVIESWKVAQVLLNAAATGHADKLETRPSSTDVRLKTTTEPQIVLTRAEWRLAVEMSRPASPELLAEAVGAEPRSVRRVLSGLLDRGLLIAGPAARLAAPDEPAPTPHPPGGPAAAPTAQDDAATAPTGDRDVAATAPAEPVDEQETDTIAETGDDDETLPPAQRASALRRLMSQMRE